MQWWSCNGFAAEIQICCQVLVDAPQFAGIQTEDRSDRMIGGASAIQSRRNACTGNIWLEASSCLLGLSLRRAYISFFSSI